MDKSVDIEAVDDQDEDPVQLSREALQALAEFYAEQEARDTEPQNGGNEFSEDWVRSQQQLSQFWYNRETSEYLTEKSLEAVNGRGKIVCISCPSLFLKLREKLESNSELEDQVSVYLLEFDERFASFGDKFLFYDYRDPLSVKQTLAAASFDLVVADPPFLSEECIKKTVLTIDYLRKDKVILCTGAVMEPLVKESLDLVPSPHFIPRHERNLANEFRCFTNFDIK